MLAPPHSTSARSYDNLHYHNYDLVAISMGTGGWVSQKFLFGLGADRVSAFVWYVSSDPTRWDCSFALYSLSCLWNWG